MTTDLPSDFPPPRRRRLHVRPSEGDVANHPQLHHLLECSFGVALGKPRPARCAPHTTGPRRRLDRSASASRAGRPRSGGRPSRCVACGRPGPPPPPGNADVRNSPASPMTACSVYRRRRRGQWSSVLNLPWQRHRLRERYPAGVNLCIARRCEIGDCLASAHAALNLLLGGWSAD